VCCSRLVKQQCRSHVVIRVEEDFQEEG